MSVTDGHSRSKCPAARTKRQWHSLARGLVAANLMGVILVNQSLNSEIGDRNIQATYFVRYGYGSVNFRVCMKKRNDLLPTYLLTY